MSGAPWISGSANGGIVDGPSALYGIPFDISLESIDSATLDISYAVDNDLGSSISEGIFVNEIPVPGTTLLGDFASFTAVHTINADITSMVNPGNNWLYIYQVDLGGPDEIIFDATISLTGNEKIFGGEDDSVDGESDALNEELFTDECVTDDDDSSNAHFILQI